MLIRTVAFSLMFALPSALLSGCIFAHEQSSLDPILANGDETPFAICGMSSSWQRASIEEQREKRRSNARYAGLPQGFLDFFWQSKFFFAYGNASTNCDLINLTGLWSLAPEIQIGYQDAKVHDAVLKLAEAELWVLDYQV